MDAVVAEGLPDWFTELMYSRWLYVIVGGIFLTVLLCGAVNMLLHRRKRVLLASGHNRQTEAKCDLLSLLDTMTNENGHARSILLVADNPRDLPVTIAINAAMHLAETSKCLLVDLDIRRDALWHVFQVDARHPASAPAPTPLDNLYLWSARNISQLPETDIENALAAAAQDYDVILFYAPGLLAHPQRTQIIGAADAAILFAGDHQSTEPLRNLLASGSCRILKTLTPETVL